jgi:hypothetical protein
VSMYGSRISESKTVQSSVVDYVFLAACFLIIPSAVLHGLLGLDEKQVFAATAPALILITLVKYGLNTHPSILSIIVTTILIGCFGSLVAQSNAQFLMSLVLAVSVIIGYEIRVLLMRPKILKILTVGTLFLLLLGLVGIIYSAGGGQPLLVVQVGYRRTSLYLTTFSFANAGNFIRPSGIFDEPGAFAMYVAMITMFNDTLRQNTRLNVCIVCLIVFTGSLAGLMLAAAYFLSSNAFMLIKNARIKIASVIIIVITAALLLFPDNPIVKSISVFYSERLVLSDGRLVGDNRSNQIEDFFEAVDLEMLLSGTKSLGQVYDVADMSSNPFSITYGYGLIISVAYFFVLGWLVWITVVRRGQNIYTSVGLIFLLLQRPYLYHMSWSILIASVLWLVYLDTSGRSRLR